MFPQTAFPQATMPFGFPGQQPQMSLYQSQFGGMAGFNPLIGPPFQPGPPATATPRGQSLPATARQLGPSAAPYVPGQSVTSRRQHHDTSYPPPAPSQHYEYHSTHGSKSKKHHKRRSISPGGAGEPSLYSDKERHDASEGQRDRSGSPSPQLVSQSKHDDANSHQRASPIAAPSGQGEEGGAQASAAAVARSEEVHATNEQERHKSGSKKKKHQRHERHERHENYNIPPNQGQPVDLNLNSAFPSVYPGQPQPQAYLPQQQIFTDFQNELPAQLKVHRQPLYTGYNQAYEESIRRGDIYRKQAKRSARLPPEVKQKLLPHEDDQPNPPISQPQGTQVYPFSQQAAPGYPQAPQAFPNIRPPFNPYQPYQNQGGYFNPNQGTIPPLNTFQPWQNVPPPVPSSEQEIQRLRSHIHTLEGELHKLQRKLNKTNLNAGNNDASEQSANQHEEHGRSHRRSKREEVTATASPRQTPVIVELNSAPAEPPVRKSSKKHRHRTGSTTSSQQGTHLPPTEAPVVQQRPVESVSVTPISVQQVPPAPTAVATEVRDQSRPPANLSAEVDERQGQNKAAASKSSREETAAQLAHAAAAHVNSRQAGPTASVQPSPIGPPLPPQGRPQVPPQLPPQHQQQPHQQQQQQHQQFLYQQGGVRPQGPPIRVPAPPVQMAGHPQGFPVQNAGPRHPMPTANPNYNQSNNNELLDNPEFDEHASDRLYVEEQNRSAEKILDAFERYYLHSGKTSTAPMKVKFIPETSPKNVSQNNTNNNNNNNIVHPYVSQQETQHSRSSSSSSSSSSESYSSSESIYSNSPISSHRSNYDNNYRATAAMKTGPFI